MKTARCLIASSSLAALLVAGCTNHEQSDRVTSGFLLRNGFVEVRNEPKHFALQHVRLKDAASRLGFTLQQLVPGTNAPDATQRSVVVRDYHMGVTFEPTRPDGMIDPHAPENPESLCAINVWLIPQWRTDYGNGEILFTKKTSGDVGRFILQRALALGAHPVSTSSLPVIQCQWRYLENKRIVTLRLPPGQSAPVESFLRQAFGPPKELFLKTTTRPLEFHGARVTNFSILLNPDPEFTQIRISSERPSGFSGEDSEPPVKTK